MYTLLAQVDPLRAFKEGQERSLAKVLAEHTGIVPVITTALTADEKPYRVLRFWMRNSDEVIVHFDLDLRDFHAKEGVKHALRNAVRTARLDHLGGPITEPPVERTPTVEEAIIAGYEQALEDFGIDKAGDDNPEGWMTRSLKRAQWRP